MTLCVCQSGKKSVWSRGKGRAWTLNLNCTTEIDIGFQQRLIASWGRNYVTPENFNYFGNSTKSPNGSMGRYESWKNHTLSTCRCVTSLLDADSMLLICRIVPRESKSIREMRDFHFLTSPCLSIEQLEGLQWLLQIKQLKIRALIALFVSKFQN